MSTYILVHGAWHGAWCWHKVVSLLEKEGHTVIAVDLPGHGTDKTPTAEVTLQSYVDSVCNTIDAQQEPVLLVGHSMGGGIITQTAEERPDKIKNLFYLTAFLPSNGESMGQLFQSDTESLLPSNIEMSTDQSYMTLRRESLKETFYEDCSDDDFALTMALLVPQAIAPFAQPINTSEEKFGRIPRIYIECRRDKILTPTFQKRSYTALPCRKVIALDTGHAPFFSAPEELARQLTSL